MAEAGQTGGITIDLLGYRNRQVTEAIIGNLRAIGVTANLQWLQDPAVVQKRRANDAPMIVDDWGSSSINDVAARTAATRPARRPLVLRAGEVEPCGCIPSPLLRAPRRHHHLGRPCGRGPRRRGSWPHEATMQ